MHRKLILVRVSEGLSYRSQLYSAYKTLIYYNNKWHSFVPIIVKSLKNYTPDMMFFSIPLALHNTIYHIAWVSTWAFIEFLEWRGRRSSKGSTYLNKHLFHISNSSLKKAVRVYIFCKMGLSCPHRISLVSPLGCARTKITGSPVLWTCKI